MNAIVQPAAGNGSAESTPGAARRIYAGEGYPQQPGADPLDYVALVPSDDDIARPALIRLMVADALQRNGKVVDEDTLEATMAHATAPGGVFAETAFVYRLSQGETRQDGMRSPPFVGYELPITAQAQKTLLDYAAAFQAQQATAPQQPVDGTIKQLQTIAAADGKANVVQTLGAIDAAIKAGQQANAAGEPIDKVALAGVMQYFTQVGKERDAARVLERYTAIKDVVGEVRTFGQNAERVFNGRDPVTRQPIDTDGRVDAAFDLLNNGFKIAGGIGTAATLLGVGGRFAPALLGVAPVGMAIVGVAAGAYGLIKNIRAEILAPRWDEIRDRFPFCPEGMDPKKAIKQIVRNIEGMPVDGDNALSTASRIMQGIGQDAETKARFTRFLKGKVDPDAIVDALTEGRLDALTREQAVQLARAAKESSKEFFDLELKDAKRYIRDRDGDRTRGTYLMEGDTRAAAERNTNKVGGTVGEVLRVAGILTGTADQVVGGVQDLIGKLKGGVTLDGKPLDAQQQRNLAAAAAAAAAGGGLSQVDALLTSKDGTRLFAIQGDPQSETRRTVAIDIATGVAQSAESSNRMREALAPNLPPVLQPDQVQRGM